MNNSKRETDDNRSKVSSPNEPSQADGTATGAGSAWRLGVALQGTWEWAMHMEAMEGIPIDVGTAPGAPLAPADAAY